MINTDNIFGFKLLNNTEMVAKLVETTDTEYVLENAMLWDVFKVNENLYDIQLMPLSYGINLSQDATHPGINISINKNIIMYKFELREEIMERYKQAVSPILLINK